MQGELLSSPSAQPELNPPETSGNMPIACLTTVKRKRQDNWVFIDQLYTG